MSDDPFAEPGDPEHTMIRPRPGGRRSTPETPRPDAAAASRPSPQSVAPPPVSPPVPPPVPPRAAPPAPPPPTPPPPAPPPTVTAPDAVAPKGPSPGMLFGTPSGSPIAAAALPLLQLLARLRTTAHQPDPADLYQRTLNELRTFEQQVRDAGVPAEQVRSAHY